MRKKLLLLVLSTLIGNLFGNIDSTEYWQKVYDFDYSFFNTKYESLNEDQLLEKGKLSYALYYTGSKEIPYAKEAEVLLSKELENNELTDKERSNINYILSEVYIDLIVDAKSWMDYNSKYEKSITECLNYDRENLLYNLNSARSMQRFPTPRGSFEDGEKLLKALSDENPNSFNILFVIADRNYNEGNIDLAEKDFLRVVEINPKHKTALERLNDIELIRKNLTIRNITIKNDVKTSEKKIFKKLSSYIGKKLDFQLKQDMNQEVSKISAIGGATIKGIQIDDGNVDLELTVNEDNTRALAFMAGGPLGLDYSNNVTPNLMGAGIYLDNNFLGSGLKFQLISAAVFNKLEIKKPGLINDGIIDLKFVGESMLLPTDNYNYTDGKKSKKLGRGTSHYAQLGLGKELPIGLITYINYKAKWEPQEDVSGVIEADESTIHEINGELMLQLAGQAMSSLQTLEGFNFTFLPKMVYRPDYKPWGRKDALFEHDDNPGWSFFTQVAYYTNITERQNLAIDLTHLGSINPYESDRFKLGHAGTPLDPIGVSGYIPGEIITDNAIVARIKYTFIQTPNKLNLFGKYDMLYDTDHNDLYKGCAVGINTKLPWDIEFSTEVGIGLDANRDNLPGLQLSILFMKMHIL